MKKVGFDRSNLLLYAVTDSRWLEDETLYEKVEQALQGGATFLQLREKKLGEEAFRREALEIQKLCRRYQVPFVLNDNVELAREIGADGVHVGQSDMEAGNVRELLGEDKIIGVTARTVEQAILAEKRGADYLGVGAVFATGTKLDTHEVSYELLKEICASVTIPVVAIGGVNLDNIGSLTGSGVAGAAVVSAIFAQKDGEGAARKLHQAALEMTRA